MKLNWAERWVVNNPIRSAQQGFIIRWMRRNSEPRAFSNVLEVGCGRGSGARLILREFKPERLQITDLDNEMIFKARRYLSSSELARAASYAADVSHLPCRSSSFDAVFGLGVLHHVEDWQRAISEIARVLKPDGSYFFEEIYPSVYQNCLTRRILLHPRHNRFFSRDLKEVLADNDLPVTAVREIGNLNIIAVCVKQ